MISISYDAIATMALVCFVCLVLMLVLIAKDTAKLPDMSTRLIRMEHMLFQLLTQTQLQSVLSEASGKRAVFRTPDGKYSASSPEELMNKIMNDPDYPKNDEELRKYFEDMMGDEDDEDEDK